MKRVDSSGRDVTDLPGLWDESDQMVSDCLAHIDAIYDDSPLTEEEVAAYERAMMSPPVTANAAFYKGI